MQESALAGYPHVASLILEIFRVRLDPAEGGDLAGRRDKAAALQERIETALQAVESLDADRVRVALVVERARLRVRVLVDRGAVERWHPASRKP